MAHFPRKWSPSEICQIYRSCINIIISWRKHVKRYHKRILGIFYGLPYVFLTPVMTSQWRYSTDFGVFRKIFGQAALTETKNYFIELYLPIKRKEILKYTWIEPEFTEVIRLRKSKSSHCAGIFIKPWSFQLTSRPPLQLSGHHSDFYSYNPIKFSPILHFYV